MKREQAKGKRLVEKTQEYINSVRLPLNRPFAEVIRLEKKLQSESHSEQKIKPTSERNIYLSEADAQLAGSSELMPERRSNHYNSCNKVDKDELLRFFKPSEIDEISSYSLV